MPGMSQRTDAMRSGGMLPTATLMPKYVVPQMTYKARSASTTLAGDALPGVPAIGSATAARRMNPTLHQCRCRRGLGLLGGDLPNRDGEGFTGRQSRLALRTLEAFLVDVHAGAVGSGFDGPSPDV